MHFPLTEYTKKTGIGTRCHLYECLTTLDTLKYPLSRAERSWFEEHPQFKHFFHMPRDKNHKMMGTWMFLLRTACIEKKKEAWFIVNGVPVRYGIREHALLSGLNCRNYPICYSTLGSKRFVNKHFEAGQPVRYQDVKDKLENMKPSPERLKMAVLYFLSSIIIAQTKCGKDATPVVEFFQRAVDDLELCRTFPWGRFSFDHMIKEISHTMDHYKGVVNEKKLWPIPGFVIPLEILAFEAIPALGNYFREAVDGVDMACPRMCKSKFKKSAMRGFLLTEINDVLDKTKDIDSVLPAVREERRLMRRLMEAEDDDDVHDPVVESWMKRLGKGKIVFFQEMYNDDVAVRAKDKEVRENAGREKPVREKPDRKQDVPVIEGSGNPSLNDLFDLMKSIKDDMGGRLTSIEEIVAGQEKRLALFEGHLKEKSGEDEKQTEAGGSSKVTDEEDKRGTKRSTRTAANVGDKKGKAKRQRKT